MSKPLPKVSPSKYAARHTMAATAAAAAIAETKAILAGVPAVPDAEIARRLTICTGCPEYRPDARRCQQCGCFLKFKTALRTAHCPAGKW